MHGGLWQPGLSNDLPLGLALRGLRCDLSVPLAAAVLPWPKRPLEGASVPASL